MLLMNETGIVASLAMSLDGYVAQTDGNVDFLEKYPMEDYDFDAFLDTVGALIMGSNSYRVILQWEWAWGDRPTMVLTTGNDLGVPAGANVRFAAMSTPEAITSFSAETPKRLWVVGGGRLVTEGLLGGAIDTLDIMVMPEALGSGVPLFSDRYDGPMRLERSETYANGATRLIYDTSIS
jgi:dihydrofolate reductase